MFGQDPLFSQINHHQLYFNPAYAGNSPYARLMAGYRNQWPGLGNAFVTYYVSYDQYVNAISSNVGAALTRDVQSNGAISRTSCDLIYSFPIELNNNTILSLGVQGSLVQKRSDAGSLTLPDQNPYETSANHEVLGSKSKIFPDFAAGASFYFGKQYLLSFSVHHLNRPNEVSGTSNLYVTPMRITMQAMAEYSLIKKNRSEDGFILYPAIMGQIQGPYSYFNWGCNIKYNVLIGGLWVRHDLSMNFTTFVVQAGYSGGATNIIYSYDAWIPGNYQQIKNYGAHEVTFIYHFKYNDPKKRMRTIKCPEISR
jgi:type IX secretion system PorP/SprF family membrane protein